MIIIETDHTSFAAQSIAARVLGWQPGVTQAGRLGVELAFEDLDHRTLVELVDALEVDRHPVFVTYSA